MTKITKRAVDDAQPIEKDSYIWDEALKGFGVKVTPAGRKVYLVQYRTSGSGGRTRRVTIGKHGTFTTDQARAQAQAILREIARGDDPARERDERATQKTTGELLDVFLHEHADKKLKSRSSAEYRRLIEKLVPATLKRKPILDMERGDISRLHSSLSATPYQANRFLAVLSKFFVWCEKNGYRKDFTNPAHHVDKFKEEKRKRFLSEAELARLGETLAEVEAEGRYSLFVFAAIRLLALTGARLDEIRSLKWESVDYDRKCLLLEDSKTGAKTIYLNPPALELLSEIPRIEGNPHVICGDKPGAHLVNLQKPWTAIRNRAGLEDVRLHDLRHSFASVAVASGMSLPLIGALLGHSQPQTTARYAHLSDDPLRVATEAIGRSIQEQLKRRRTIDPDVEGKILEIRSNR